MKKFAMNTIRGGALVLALAGLGVSGSAVASYWNFGDSNSTTDSAGSDVAVGVTATAYSAANNTTNLASATAVFYTPTNDYGLGVTHSGESTGSPQHSTDNSGQIDSLLFTFSGGNKVNLTGTYFGWANNTSTTIGDTDFSVYAYTGTGAPASQLNLTNFSYTSLANTATSGWTLVGQYGATNGTGFKSITGSSGIYSSYWLIGAYNGVSSSNTVGTLGVGNDYFKLLKLAGTVCTGGECGGNPNETPEPGTLLLIGAGLFGLSRFNTRRPLRCAA